MLDRSAERQRIQFLQIYPAVAELADVSFVEAKISPDNPQVWSTVEKIVRDLPLLGVVICFNDDQTGLYGGLSMRRLLDDLSRIHVPVILRLGRHRHLGQFVAAMESRQGQHNRFQVFGSLEELLSPNILIRGELDTLAKAIHTQYRDSRQFVDVLFRNLPKVLAEANFEIRRQHKILAIEAMLGTAMSMLKSATANEEKGCVVIADVDSIEGCKAAEIALKLPDVALWVVSSGYPRQFHDLPQLRAICEGAAGWATREQFRGA